MSAHTPGPWTVEQVKGAIRVVTVQRRFEGSSEGHFIAEIPTIRTARWINAERDANARLMAAAPDLLAALEAVVASASPHPVEHPSMTKAWAIAEAAIAKARGGK